VRLEDVADLHAGLKALGIEVWIDGGWGVDALLGAQSRPHRDLDIAIQQKDVAGLRAFLEPRGYRDVERPDTRPWNFVLGDDRGHEVDVHVIVLDERRNGIYGPKENGEMYPAPALSGTGVLAGRTVRCISPEWVVRFHSGYALTDKDYADVSALCNRFQIPLPQEYERFRTPSR
jgi:lincosamide nucleotidyltransferase A/C/D/E